ncbi:hypothetical protein EK904_001758 [Melospiza melodia maxima]|nr:hypothetical protein EK904_001758 [Melospiza melodia maxima]
MELERDQTLPFDLHAVLGGDKHSHRNLPLMLLEQSTSVLSRASDSSTWPPAPQQAQSRDLSQTTPHPKSSLNAGPASSKWSLSCFLCPCTESCKMQCGKEIVGEMVCEPTLMLSNNHNKQDAAKVCKRRALKSLKLDQQQIPLSNLTVPQDSNAPPVPQDCISYIGVKFEFHFLKGIEAFPGACGTALLSRPTGASTDLHKLNFIMGNGAMGFIAANECQVGSDSITDNLKIAIRPQRTKNEVQQWEAEVLPRARLSTRQVPEINTPLQVQSIPTCKFLHKPKSLTEAEINCQEPETNTLSRTVDLQYTPCTASPEQWCPKAESMTSISCAFPLG